MILLTHPLIAQAPALYDALTSAWVCSRVMIRSVGLLVLLSTLSYGQCRVTIDQAGRLITICKGYAPKDGFLMNRPDQSQTLAQTIYLGSPFLSYPIYEEGALEFTANHQKLLCKIAFNLVTNQVLAQFAGDTTEHAVLPDAFTVGTRRFVSKIGRKGERVYYRVLYAAKSRVLAQMKCTLQLTNREPYDLNDWFDGTFTFQERFFIEREAQPIQAVTLSKKSVLKALPNASDRILPETTKDKLTVFELIGAVASYDGFQ